MANNEIKVRDLADTSTIATDNQIMVLMDESNNTVKNITVKDFLTNIISSNSNNAINTGSDNKLFTSDLTVDIGNLTSLTTTNKSSLVNAVNEINSNVLVSKGFLENGTAYNNPTIYNNVYQYNHSSFDLSKFTVVGSPVITDDGIMTLPSSPLSYVVTSVQFADLVGKSYKINYETTITSDFLNSDERLFGHYDELNAEFKNEGGGHLVFNYKLDDTDNNTTTTLQLSAYLSSSLSVGDEFKVETGYILSTKTYYLKAWQNETLVIDESATSNYYITNSNNYIQVGVWDTDATKRDKSKIDLKQFSITVDDYPVFNGNKTGLDIIKADDYTVVGTPTITSDGVASGFSATSYLTHTMNFSGSGFKARIPFKVTSTNATQEFFYNSNLQLRLLYVSASTALYPSAYLTDGINTPQPRTTTYKIVANTNYIVEYEYIQGTSFSIKLYSSDGITLLDSVTNTASSIQSVNLPNVDLTTYIGATNTGANVFSGSIDLAGTRIETNTEVYRPFLQIPYVLSSTGSKIVDSAYRDRVQDVYREYGKALYYTIDETNKDVTLPMGEIYGFMGKTIQYSYRNGITYYDVYSDNTLEIGGTCTSGTTYNLPRAFKDANYVLTIPYSAKTATSFTPSATGDFIAKGVSA